MFQILCTSNDQDQARATLSKALWRRMCIVGHKDGTSLSLFPDAHKWAWQGIPPVCWEDSASLRSYLSNIISIILMGSRNLFWHFGARRGAGREGSPLCLQ